MQIDIDIPSPASSSCSREASASDSRFAGLLLALRPAAFLSEFRERAPLSRYNKLFQIDDVATPRSGEPRDSSPSLSLPLSLSNHSRWLHLARSLSHSRSGRASRVFMPSLAAMLHIRGRALQPRMARARALELCRLLRVGLDRFYNLRCSRACEPPPGMQLIRSGRQVPSFYLAICTCDACRRRRAGHPWNDEDAV